MESEENAVEKINTILQGSPEGDYAETEKNHPGLMLLMPPDLVLQKNLGKGHLHLCIWVLLKDKRLQLRF